MSRYTGSFRKSSIDTELFHTVAQDNAPADGNGVHDVLTEQECREPQESDQRSALRDSLPNKASDVHERIAVRPVTQPEGAREQSLRLVQRVFLNPLSSDRVRAVVFSPVEQSDSGEVCAWAGEMLAAQDAGKVCLVDANLHTPTLHHYFGEANDFGFASFLACYGPVTRYARQLSGSNLWLMPSGTDTSTSPPLKSDRLQTCISELQAEFDYLLIQSRDTTDYDDAIALGHCVDGVVLVLEANSTKRAVAVRAKKNLEAGHVRLLGAVLNKRMFPIPEAIYRRFC